MRSLGVLLRLASGGGPASYLIELLDMAGRVRPFCLNCRDAAPLDERSHLRDEYAQVVENPINRFW
jgi:hypothetical protein